VGCADGVGVTGMGGGATLGLGATTVGDGVGGVVAVGGAVADGVTDDRGGAGWCVESSDTVRTLTTSTIRATIPIPPPKTTRLRSDQPL
jgi:hypothetical protein